MMVSVTTFMVCIIPKTSFWLKYPVPNAESGSDTAITCNCLG